MAGSFVLFAAPFLLLSDAAGEPAGSGLTVFLGAVAVLLFALGYYFLSLAGHRSARSPKIRAITATLIVFQLIAGGWVLSASHNPPVLIASAPLLSLSVFLFMAFVWPGDGARNHRPMRRRDHSPTH